MLRFFEGLYLLSVLFRGYCSLLTRGFFSRSGDRSIDLLPRTLLGNHDLLTRLLKVPFQTLSSCFVLCLVRSKPPHECGFLLLQRQLERLCSLQFPLCHLRLNVS